MIREKIRLMPVQQKVFIGIAIFSLLVAPLSFGGDKALLPEWSLTIPSGHLSALYYMPVWFFLIAVLYKQLDKRKIRVSRLFFALHLLITVIPLLYLCFFTFFYVASIENIDANDLLMLLRFNEGVWQVFLAGQVFFAMSLIFRLFFRSQPAKEETLEN